MLTNNIYSNVKSSPHRWYKHIHIPNLSKLHLSTHHTLESEHNNKRNVIFKHAACTVQEQTDDKIFIRSNPRFVLVD